MGIHYSPAVIQDGLMFYYDMGNDQKSWKGAPTTNLLSGNLSDFGDIYGNATKTIIGPNEVRFVNNGIGVSTVRMYVNPGILVNGSTYGVSVYVKDVIGNIFFDWCDTTIIGGVNSLNSDGRLYGLGTRATYDSTFRFLDVDIGIGGAVTLYNPQVDSIPLVTPYIVPTTTRSNTQAILDLVGNRTITANSLTYSSNNTFSFKGNGQRAVISGLRNISNSTTWSAWIRCTDGSASTYNMFMGRYLPYFSFFSGNRLYFSNDIGGVQQTIQTDANLTSNVWYNATFTTSYNGANTTMKIYTNGVETASATYSGVQTQIDYDFAIGDGYDANWYRFDGEVSVVQIYNRTLSALEIEQNFSALRGRYGV